MSSTNWIQHAGNTMPTVNSDNTLTFNGGVNEYIADDYLLDSTQDFEITVEFDNNTTSSGTHDFAMFLIGEPMGSNPPLMILRQQGYSAWGANNSFFFGLYDGSSSYTSSGAGPAQLASGAMRIKKTGSLYEFFSSSDKVAFTKMGEIDTAGQPFASVDPLKVVIKAGSRTTEVSGYSNSQQPTPETTLEGHWSFDNGNAVADVGTDGAATGASFGTEDGRTVATFDGSGDKITIPDVDILDVNGTDSRTFSGWFKFDASMSGLYTIFTKRSFSSNNTGYVLWRNTDGVLYFQLASGSTIASVSSQSAVSLDEWHHIAIVVNRASAQLEMYVDGSLMDNSDISSVGDLSSTNPFILGWGDNVQDYLGHMDDIRVYSMALDATQVSTLHTETTVVPTPETTLVAHYTFDDLTDGAGSYDLTAYDGASVSGGAMILPNRSGGMKPSSKIPLASEFTVSLWFKNLKDRSLAQSNFLMFTGNRGTQNDYIFCIYHNDELAAFKGGMISSGYSMTHLTHSGWHHLVAVYDNGTLTYYVDGVQAGNSISYANSGEIELFGSFDGAYEYAPADEMDDIRVYSMALDASEVATLHTETTVSPPATPIQKNGYYPLYLAESDANGHAGGDGSSHFHEFDGVTYYMPNGLTMGVDRFHGTYGLVLKHDCDDASADVGSSNATLASVTSETILGRNAWSFSGQSSTVVLDSNKPSFSANSSWTLSMWFYNLKPTGNFRTAARSAATPDIPIMIENTSTNLGAYKHNTGFIDSGFDMAHTEYTGWNHIAAVGEGSNIKYYVNGSLVGTASTNHAWDLASIGNYQYSSYNQQFADAISDLRVHTRSMDADEVAYWYAETTVSDSGAYDWTHSGQLTNIVKFVRGQDLNGNPSYAYAKKEDDNTTTLYFTPDLTNFAAFNSYDSGASSIDGSPIFIEYGAGGKVAVGTDTGKVYQIELDEYSVPQGYTLLHDVVGGHPVNSLKYGFAMNVWIFEAGGDIYTIPAAGGGAVMRHTLPAGAKVVDFAEGDDGKVAFIVRMADFSIEPRMAPADWSVIYGPSSMVADASVATDFNYSHAMDLWVSSNAGGSNITMVGDLLDLLT